MKKSHILALVLIAVLIGVILSMTSEYSSYETFASARQSEGNDFHVVGNLAENADIFYDPLTDANYFSFNMIDKNEEVRKVVYRGAKPTDFERSEQIVLTGAMQGDEFHANKILMKCPSKYVEGELTVETVESSVKSGK